LGDIELYHSIDPVDGTFNGVSLLDNSIIMIGAENGVDVDKLLKLLE
jgi:fructose-1,6-bisphosphatase/inositol monophosphatase family enzyme